MSTLWVRADGSSTLGLGHLMRTLAVAEEAVERGLDVAYVIAGDGLERGVAVAARGFPTLGLTSASDRSWLNRVGDGDFVVFDGYHFGPVDFGAARERGAVVAAVDDLGTGTFPVDVLLNQNLVPDPSYEVDASTEVLLGPRFALVRREFRERRRLRGGGAGVLLLTFGGSDVAGLAASAVTVLDSARPLPDIRLVTGPAAPDVRELADTREWLTVSTPSEVAEEFDGADAVVSAAGSTTWELLCMGLPAALVEVADNQRYIGREVGRLGAAMFLGDPDDAVAALPAALKELADPAWQRELGRRAMKLVDGRGAVRVLDALSRRALYREARS